MLNTLKILITLIVTFAMAFATSLLLNLNLVQQHWSRETLILILMTIEIIFGFSTMYRLILDLKTKKDA
jgi:hypothetical protein